MSIPLVSVVSSAAKPYLWADWYKSMEGTIPFEVVAVGPNPPTYALPNNFKFILSKVKPVQCWEIATRNAIGQYLVFMADDQLLQGPDPFKRLIAEYMPYNTDKLMLSLRWLSNVGLAPIGIHQHVTDPNIYMPVGFMITNNFYRHLGGLDRNFIALYWDLDLCFRVAMDGLTRVSSVIALEKANISPGLWDAYKQVDQEVTVNKIWPITLGQPLKRSQPLEPFVDDNILLVSQGPKGVWA